MESTAITVMHKYIRREMFDFSQRLFRAGSHDVTALTAAFGELERLLATHAAQEEHRLEPLLRASDELAAVELLREHAELEHELRSIGDAVQQLSPQAADLVARLLRLHLDWNRFVARYLMHLDHEERSMFVVLKGDLPIGALAGSALAQGPEGRKFLDRLWSVTTPAERCALERAVDLEAVVTSSAA
jgi:hypothetical protein